MKDKAAKRNLKQPCVHFHLHLTAARSPQSRSGTSDIGNRPMHFEFRTVDFTKAATLVKRFHYSKNLPNVVRQNFAAYHGNSIHAVACYGPCVSRKVPANWIELRRLVKVPNSSLILSQFLAWTIREMRKRKAPVLMSWADPEQYWTNDSTSREPGANPGGRSSIVFPNIFNF